MSNSKLLDLLRALDPSEWRWFRDYFHSPYFNKHQEVRALGDHLLGLAKKGFPPEALPREVIYASLYPGQVYNEKHFHHLASQLLKLGESFLAQRRLEQQPFTLKIAGLAACADRKLTKSHDALRRQFTVPTPYPALPESDVLWQQYQLADWDQFHFARQEVRGENPYLQAASDRLDAFYLRRKLAYACAMTWLGRTYPSQYQPPPQEWLQNLIDRCVAPDPTLQVYIALYQLVHAANPADLLPRFCQLVVDQASHLNALHKSECFNYVVNICAERVRRGERNYLDTLLNWYEAGLSSGLILENGQLSPWNFKNIVRLGLGYARYAWVEGFIREYASFLPPDNQRDALHFSLADLSYHLGHFGQTLDHLNQVEFSDLSYSLGAKVLLIKIYYETHTDEALLSLLSSLRIQLKRNQELNLETKLAYTNFAEAVHHLFRQRQGKPVGKFNEQHLLQTPFLYARTWLIQQFRHLSSYSH